VSASLCFCTFLNRCCLQPRHSDARFQLLFENDPVCRERDRGRCEVIFLAFLSRDPALKETLFSQRSFRQPFRFWQNTRQAPLLITAFGRSGPSLDELECRQGSTTGAPIRRISCLLIPCPKVPKNGRPCFRLSPSLPRIDLFVKVQHLSARFAPWSNVRSLNQLIMQERGKSFQPCRDSAHLASVPSIGSGGIPNRCRL
jgi:hypothetical protein